MNKYLITLTPIDRFFFGGEITFTRSKRENSDKKSQELAGEEKELKSFDENYSSYVVRSNQFPQQTSLLGMLRFTVLSNNGKAFGNGKIKDTAEAEKIIGKESFNIDQDSEMNFGQIKKIYPCVLQYKVDANHWEDLIYSPMDHGLKLSFQHNATFLNKVKTKSPVIEGYKAKDGITSYCLGTKEYKTCEIFEEDVRIGIDRNFDGKTNSGAYYKQISFRLNSDLRFAFYAELSESIPDSIVSLGGDNSNFKMTCTPIDDNIELELPAIYSQQNFDNCYGKVVLLSDAFIDNYVMESCLFSINDVVSFRFLQSDVNTKDYYKFSGNNHLKRSENKYNLYKRGSIFYFEDKETLEKFTTELDSKERFVQIGYNHYKTIIKNK